MSHGSLKFLTVISFPGYAQTQYTGFGYNGESDLDLEYAMNLVTAQQPVTLYQAGDMVEGKCFHVAVGSC